jgi:hypothetical protein
MLKSLPAAGRQMLNALILELDLTFELWHLAL